MGRGIEASFRTPTLRDASIRALRASRVALAYVVNELAAPGKPLAVEILGQLATARVAPDALHDQYNLGLKG